MPPMKHLTHILVSLYHRKWMKYSLVTLIAAGLLGFVGENSLWNLHGNRKRIAELKEEIRQYTDRYENDQRLIEQLSTDPNAIRRIARERYFMKAADEDIFVLSDDTQKQSTINTDHETTE